MARRNRPRPRRLDEAIPFGRALRALREACGWTQDQLGLELAVSRRTLGNWECGYWLPPLKHRVHLVLALREAPPAHVLSVADALGVTGDRAVAPLLAQFERALDVESGAGALVPPAPAPLPPPPAPPPPPARVPPPAEAVRRAVDSIVQTSADTLDVRASDLRAAVVKILIACEELGANLEETRVAATALPPVKRPATFD
jgi:transcriptional regulator with XRE-family HTH domain